MKIYVDLDGVLVFLDAGIAECLGMTMDEMYSKWTKGIYSVSAGLNIPSIDIWKAAGKRSEDKNFWAELPEYPWAKELWEKCNDLADTAILTAPIWSCPELVPACLSGKGMWMQKFTGNPKFDKYHITQAKQDCARWDRILIDDREENIAKFTEAGGKGILFPYHGNRLHHLKDNPLPVVFEELDRMINEIKSFEAAAAKHTAWGE
jgi:hypothetical protein